VWEGIEQCNNLKSTRTRKGHRDRGKKKGGNRKGKGWVAQHLSWDLWAAKKCGSSRKRVGSGHQLSEEGGWTEST